ncbi:hypothetical protein [Antrihabitans cavernicola]|uniref:Uncharacterized protein n=1 Tax=Antrihabitans cavernicola TaxID=2495913 RepID=A0A5A7SAV0_9NOCA|nr:hypothetical protein [Spelaeibacter cavernicola]KAA0021655.1 hypothetical protein FOY51_17345 [Spelaeibacter cavernicola]
MATDSTKEFPSRTPIIGMFMVFAAMAIVAVTAYQHAGWFSIIGYAIALVVAVFGFWFTFRDLSDPDALPRQPGPQDRRVP